MDRRNFCKSIAAVLSAGAVSTAIPAQSAMHDPFAIDHDYVKSQWEKIKNGGEKRGGIVCITRELYEKIKKGEYKIELSPQWHVVDVFDEPLEDLKLLKVMGDDLPVVREGDMYPRIAVYGTHHQ